MENRQLPSPSMRALSLLAPFIGLVGFIVPQGIDLSRQGAADWKQVTLGNIVGWFIGAHGIAMASPHIFMPAPVARSIGWEPSPFQWELGFAMLSIGVLGVTADSFGCEYTLATIIVASISLYAFALGHVRDMVKERNFSIGNGGPIFFMDWAYPTAAVAVLLLDGSVVTRP